MSNIAQKHFTYNPLKKQKRNKLLFHKNMTQLFPPTALQNTHWTAYPLFMFAFLDTMSNKFDQYKKNDKEQNTIFKLFLPDMEEQQRAAQQGGENTETHEQKGNQWWK